MSDEATQLATIDPPRAVRVRTSTGWADLAIAGAPGEKWWTGSGAPSGGIGVTNDWYLDSSSGDYYEKTGSSTWTLRGNLKGPQGAQGTTGAQGPTGAPGAPGQGVPVGGATGQALVKKTATDYDTQWAAAGADLIYDGDYTSGPTYKDGEIVVYNGIAYIATMPTSSPPSAWPGGPTLAPNPMPNYGTTLPASPINGQEAILVDNVANPSYQWRFRYNTNSTSPYKWEFIGGSAYSSYVEASESTSAAAPGYVDLTTVGPQVTVPRAGEYTISFGFRCQSTVAGGYASGGASIGGAAVANQNSLDFQSATANQNSYVGKTTPVTVSGAGMLIKIQYATYSGGTATFLRRWLSVVPQRVA